MHFCRQRKRKSKTHAPLPLMILFCCPRSTASGVQHVSMSEKQSNSPVLHRLDILLCVASAGVAVGKPGEGRGEEVVRVRVPWRVSECFFLPFGRASRYQPSSLFPKEVQKFPGPQRKQKSGVIGEMW